MGEKRTPQGILIRKVRFEFPPDSNPHWNPAKPEWSQMVNSVSVVLPYFEPFIIDSIREASPHITDANLQQEAAGLIGQESQHFRQHRRFNEVLIAKGYEQLRAHEQRMTRDYERFKTRPLKFQVAYCAGLETMALGMGHLMIQHRDYFFGDADPNVSSMFLWHFVEEIEHKNAAFDVYQHVYGDYWYRVYGMACGLLHLFSMVRDGYIILLKADGLWGKWKTRWAIKKLAFRLWSGLLPYVFRHALPWHHPSKVADPAWMQEWVALYDQEEQGLTKLDTTKMALSPAGMLPT
ncbi:MAG: metal-dependent hydrolase [Candidatus Binatia bacterium]